MKTLIIVLLIAYAFYLRSALIDCSTQAKPEKDLWVESRRVLGVIADGIKGLIKRTSFLRQLRHTKPITPSPLASILASLRTSCVTVSGGDHAII